MQALELRQLISRLPSAQPLTDAFERRNPLKKAPWYSSQKEHLVGWLDDYGGAGAYDRQRPGQDARHFYMHFQCAPGLLWLAEALGEEPKVLKAAIKAIEAAGAKGAAQCGAFRKVISWTRIEALVAMRKVRPAISGEDAFESFIAMIKDAPFGQGLISESEVWQQLGLVNATKSQQDAALVSLAQHVTVTPHPRKKAIYFEASGKSASRPVKRKKAATPPQQQQPQPSVTPVQPLDLNAPTMRAVSIRQPYIELILQGRKDIEYRTWRIKPGPILLHASKTLTEVEEWTAQTQGVNLDEVPFGALVGVVDIVHVTGDGETIRWHLANPRRFTTPVSYKGAASIMRVPTSVIQTQLKEMTTGDI